MAGRASGAVLTGGRSRRMGRDKALIPIDGVAMAQRVAAAMTAAGVEPVVAIGGDAAGLASLGLPVVPDATPGEGPLGGILTAMAAAAAEWVVVTACDMPWIGADQVRALLDALAEGEEVDVVVSAAAGDLQPLHAAWRVAARERLALAFDAGERAPRRALTLLPHRVVDLGAGEWSIDLDEPR